MVKLGRWKHTLRVSGWLISTGTSVACDATVAIPDFDETPTIALTIVARATAPLYVGAPGDSGLFATLVTTGTPVHSPYLRAERFEMTRVSDGARFAWRAVDTETDGVGIGGAATGNYFLPRSGGTAGLGSDSIVEGELYELVVEAGPHRIIGRTRVPGKIEFVREAADDDTIVRWRRTPGAAQYLVAAEYIASISQLEDTMLVVRWPEPFPDDPLPRRIVVIALDTNQAAFRDTRVERAGITGGWGVFGSLTAGQIAFPPRTAGASP